MLLTITGTEPGQCGGWAVVDAQLNPVGEGRDTGHQVDDNDEVELKYHQLIG